MSTATIGTTLPTWELPLTPTLIVSTAIATRDFQDVHHDRDLAQGHGSKDVFMNILTTTGLVQRYVGEWAREALGPDFRIAGCALRLGAPAYPYDTMTFSGAVVDDPTAPTEAIVIDVVGVVSLGNHVNAKVTVLPGASA